MKLELGKIYIKDIRFGDNTEIKNGTLIINKKELEEFAISDERIKSVTIELARPGESIRIAPVKDVIEPRVKVSGPGCIFPGVMGKVKGVGSGRTHALVGAAVVTVGTIVGFQEGIIYM